MEHWIEKIRRERQRQIEDEGWTPEHDDQHDPGELSGAAAAYALHAGAELHPGGTAFKEGEVPNGWCWDEAWWKPGKPVKNLVKAAALIIAELERIEREAGRALTPSTQAED